MKRSFLLCLAVIATAWVCLAPQHSSLITSAKSDKFKTVQDPIPNRYIVVLEEAPLLETSTSVETVASALSNKHRGKPDKIYSNALKGYSVEMTETAALKLAEDPLVKYVEEDAIVESQAIQTDATWGISRIDQRDWQYPLSTEYRYNATGAGVHVYVIDSGVLTSHPEFGGRAVEGYDPFVDHVPFTECSGHGTHVAGTIGSNTYGVAKGVVIHSVRVQPCSDYATTSTVIAGIDWINRNVQFPAVANMSLASTYSRSFEDAVKNSIARGITYTVSAGNYATNACNYSPAHLPEAITVGSMGSSDSWDPSTNYGSCIDLFAPGVSIRSVWNATDFGTFDLSGTSTAAPHVAGVAALYLEKHPNATPAQVQDALIANATQGAVYGLTSSTPNRLLFSDFLESAITPVGCTGESFDGVLLANGATAFQSSKVGFVAPQGILKGNLNVPDNANFRLHLEKKTNGGKRASDFQILASSPGGGIKESIEFRVKNGTYRWRIESLTGTGSYSLCSEIP